MAQKIIPILMYHSIKTVSRAEVMRSVHVAPKAFALQMRILKTFGFRGCSVSEAISAIENGTNERLVGLTFDDGYENFFYEALPILSRFDFSATVYCVSNFIGKSNEWDAATGISKNMLMNDAQIKKTISHGIEIGCHSATHKSLIAKECDIHYEISSAKSDLQNRFQTETNSFCYPYGHLNEKIISAVREAGFSSATTMVRSRATSNDSPFTLPRIPVTWHTLPHLFLIKLLTRYEDSRRHR